MANKLLENFPDTIPGAYSVEKHFFERAKYTLVHVRQMHTVTGMTEKEKQEVVDVQRSIYHILDHLIRNNYVKEVFVEGVTKGTHKR